MMNAATPSFPAVRARCLQSSTKFSVILIFAFFKITMNMEKFCLRWNDFESNLSTAFKELRNEKEFFDLTLVCDNEQIPAHKVKKIVYRWLIK